MKIWVIRRRTLRMALLIAVGAVLAAVLGTSVVRRAVPAAASARKIPIYSVETAEKKISI